MQIFRRRPMFLACTAFMGMSVILYCFKFYNIALYIGVVFAVLAVFILILSIVKKRKKILLISIVSIALSLASFESFWYFGVEYEKMSSYHGTEQCFEAVVLSENYSYSYMSSYNVGLVSVNDEKAYGKAVVVFPNKEYLETGNRIKFSAYVYDITSQGQTDSDYSYFLANGFFVSLDALDRATVIDRNNVTFSTVMADMNAFASDILTCNIGGEEGNLASALLLGNRTLISDEIRFDFNRCGVSHLLALSGMHFTIIMGAVEVLLKKLRVSKLIRCPLLCATSLFYLALTGFALSACRAVIMLIVVYISHMISADSDTLTALGISGALIIMLSPSTVLDCGFWLSWFATFGLVVFSTPINEFCLKKFSRFAVVPRKILTYVISSLLISIVAFVFVVVLSWLYFGQISLLSVLATLIASPLVTASVVLSLILIFVNMIAPIVYALSFIIRMLCQLTIFLIDSMSSWHGIVVSLNYGFVFYIMIAFASAMAILLTVKVRKKIIFVIPTALLAIALSVGIGIVRIMSTGQTDIAFVSNNDNDFLLINSGGSEAVVCDISNGRYSSYRQLFSQIKEANKTEIEVLIITHLHKNHLSSLEYILSSNIVRRIYLYEETVADKSEIYREAYEIADRCGVEIEVFDWEDRLELAAGDLCVIRSYNRSDLHLTVMVNYEKDGVDLTYLSNGLSDISDMAYNVKCIMIDSEYVIFGEHGASVQKPANIECGRGTRLVLYGSEENALNPKAFVPKDCVVEVYDGVRHFLIE